MSSVLDPKIRELIAIGACIAANCQTWLEYHYKEARAANANLDEIKETIKISEIIKRVGGNKIREVAENLHLTSEIKSEE